MTVLDIQRRLETLGFDPGPLDGAWGPWTRAAALAFQKSVGLATDGVPGPKTIAALRERAPGEKAAPVADPVWVQEGRRRLGLHESNPKLKAFLSSDGRTLGDPERAPWCGDFVETCVRIALPDEVVPANPYLARNWLAFGVDCSEAALGAIAVFSRPPGRTSGHVGFVVAADRTYLSVLGGNQSNMISVARLARRRLLGCRWPKTAGPAGAAAPKSLGAGAVSTNEA